MRLRSTLLVPLLCTMVAGCSSIGGAPIKHVVELFMEGGEKPLREAMRPLRGGSRVLVFALDGVGEEDFRRALDEGNLPSVAALLGPRAGAGVYAHGYAASGTLSVLPSITMAAWTSAFTVRPPGETGVPGNEWFERETMRFYAPAPVAFSSNDHAIRMYTKGLIGEQTHVPTLFEQADVRSFVSMLPLSRGADLLQLPKLNTFGDLFFATVQGAVRGRPTRKSYSETDQNSVRSVIAGLKEYGAPDLQVVYFPGIDLMRHVSEQPDVEVQRYLAEITDSLIASVLDEYRRQGVLERTYVMFVSDHGHTPVMTDDRHRLLNEPAELLDTIGVRVRSFGIDSKTDDFQAVLAYQGSMAFVYLADRSTCRTAGERCAWSRSPRETEDVLPVVRAFDRANRTGELMPALKGTIDLIFARPSKHFWQRGARPFQVWDGQQLVPIATYLKRHPRPDLLRLAERMQELGTGPYGAHAGDVVLLANARADRPVEMRFYFGADRYTSWHGSPSAPDSRVPLVVAHPARSGTELRQLTSRTLGATPSLLDVTPLVRALLRN